MPYQANQTLICLIPKCPDTSSLRNFRSIGLYNTNYKLVTKIIINRIKPILPSLIGSSQPSFLTNKRAFNNTMIVQEFVSHFGKIKGKKAGMVLKIDLEKAFDRLEWSFIKETLLFFRFSYNLVDLIMSYVSSTVLKSLSMEGKPKPSSPLEA